MIRLRHVFALLLALLLAGCGGAQPVPTPSPAAAATPNPALANLGNGGTLIMALGARDPNTLDPALAGDTGSAFIIHQLFSGLVRLDAQLAVQPDLAASWQLSADKRTYSFSLRPDARFADGRPIGSADVIYSLERASDPKLAPALPAATYLGDIVGVREKVAGSAGSIAGLKATDDHTVAITIDAPKPYFLSKLAHVTSFVVDRRAVEGGGESWTDRPNGSGPFTIERWDHDQLLVLARNLNFYRAVPKLDRVRFLIGAAASNPLLLYEQGQVDLTDVPAYALDRVQDTSNPISRELLSVPQLSLYYVGMNVTLPPFDDPKVRQAFALLIDRAKIAEVSLAGAAQPARGILPPGMPGYDPTLPAVAADIARAKALLADSRYGGATKLPPIVAYGGWADTLREVAKDTLGITIEVRGYEDYGDYLGALDKGQFQLYGSGWVADYPDPENFLDLLFRGGSGENHSGYNSPALNELLSQAAVEGDSAKRYDLYHRAERQIIADAPVIPLYHDVAYTLVKPYVRGLTVTPLGILDLSTVELVR